MKPLIRTGIIFVSIGLMALILASWDFWQKGIILLISGFVLLFIGILLVVIADRVIGKHKNPEDFKLSKKDNFTY